MGRHGKPPPHHSPIQENAGNAGLAGFRNGGKLMHPSHPADESGLLCGSAPASCSRPMERATAPDWVRPVVSRRRVAVAAGTGRSISAGRHGGSTQEAAARRAADTGGRLVDQARGHVSFCGRLMAIPPPMHRTQLCVGSRRNVVPWHRTPRTKAQGQRADLIRSATQSTNTRTRTEPPRVSRRPIGLSQTGLV